MIMALPVGRAESRSRSGCVPLLGCADRRRPSGVASTSAALPSRCRSTSGTLGRTRNTRTRSSSASSDTHDPAHHNYQQGCVQDDPDFDSSGGQVGGRDPCRRGCPVRGNRRLPEDDGGSVRWVRHRCGRRDIDRAGNPIEAGQRGGRRDDTRARRLIRRVALWRCGRRDGTRARRLTRRVARRCRCRDWCRVGRERPTQNAHEQQSHDLVHCILLQLILTDEGLTRISFSPRLVK